MPALHRMTSKAAASCVYQYLENEACCQKDGAGVAEARRRHVQAPPARKGQRGAAAVALACAASPAAAAAGQVAKQQVEEHGSGKVQGISSGFKQAQREVRPAVGRCNGTQQRGVHMQQAPEAAAAGGGLEPQRQVEKVPLMKLVCPATMPQQRRDPAEGQAPHQAGAAQPSPAVAAAATSPAAAHAAIKRCRIRTTIDTSCSVAIAVRQQGLQ